MRSYVVQTIYSLVDKFSAPLKAIGIGVSEVSGKADKARAKAQEAAARHQRNMQRLQNIAKAGVAGVTGILTAAVVRGQDFEQIMVNATAKFPEGIKRGTKAYEEFQDAVLRVSAKTEFTATEVAGALNFLATAGFNSKQSLAALPGVIDLATASATDLGLASDVASDALGAFNLMSSDSVQLGKNLARVNDVLAKTANTANTRVDLLYETFKKGAPVATKAGASIETYMAIAGQIAGKGIKGSIAGTGLKQLFLKLQAPASAGSKALTALGIRTRDASGKLRDVLDIIEEMGKKTNNFTQDMALKDVFGEEAIVSVSALLTDGIDKVREYRKVLEGSQGISVKLADQMRDTFKGRWNTLLSTIEAILINVFLKIQGPLEELLEQATQFLVKWAPVIIESLQQAFHFINKNKAMIAAWMFNLLKVWLVFKAIGFFLKAFVFVLGVALMIVLGFVSPLKIFLAGIVSGIALFAALYLVTTKFFKELVKGAFEIHALWPTMKKAAVGFFKSLGGFVAHFAKAIYKALVWVDRLPNRILDHLIRLMPRFLSYLAHLGGLTWDFIKDVGSRALNFISSIMSTVYDVVSWPYKKLFDYYVWFFETLQGLVTGELAQKVFGSLTEAFLGVKDFFYTMWEGVVGIFDWALRSIKNGVNTLKNFLPDFLTPGSTADASESDFGKGLTTLPSASERALQSFSEKRMVNESEVTIRDETGRAEMRTRRGRPNRNLRLQKSGGF